MVKYPLWIHKYYTIRYNIRAPAIFIFDKCLYLRGRLRLTIARRLSAYMSSRALATTTASSYYYYQRRWQRSGQCEKSWIKEFLRKLLRQGLLRKFLESCQLELNNSTRVFFKCIAWDGSPPPGECPIRKNMYFCPGTDTSRRSAWKLAWHWHEIGYAVPYVRFSTFGGDKFRGFLTDGQNVFGQFVFDVASVTCVASYTTVNWCVAVPYHQWILFIAPSRGRRRRCWLTCDKLRRSSKWWSRVIIQQWSTRYSSRIASFS